MTTTSGSGSSATDETQGGEICLEIENLGCHIFDAPHSHGSTRIVKLLGGRPGEGGRLRTGWKVRRKDESEFRCLTVKDIFDEVDDSIKEAHEAHDLRASGGAERARSVSSPRKL